MNLRLSLAVSCALALPAAADPPPPATVDVGQAVRQLGDKRFATREAASRQLWQAGAAAEPALRRALTDPDPEVVRRAKALLDKFDWGIYPDTPPAVVAILERYRDGDADGRRAAARELAQHGRPGFLALAKLRARATDDEDKARLAEALTQAAAKAMPPLLAARDYAAAESLLESVLDAEADESVANYVALVLLRGRLDPALERWRAEPPGPKTAAVLAALHRAKGDYAAARKAAAGRDELLDELIWEQGDWKELARRPGLVRNTNSPAARPAAKALCLQMAGDAAGAAAAGTELAGATDEDGGAVKGLLLTGRPADALAKLDRLTAPFPPAFGDVPKRVIAFDVLLAQLRYQEAFALAARPPADGEDDDPRRLLAVRQARARYQVGDVDAAGQMFARAAERLRAPADGPAAKDIVQAQLRLGLTDAGRETAARYLETLAQRAVAESQDPTKDVLEATFPRRGAEARTWWRFLRQKFPKEDGPAAMRRLTGLLDPPRTNGAVPPGPGELAAALVAAQPDGKAADEVAARLAVAAAHEAADQADPALDELTKAAERSGDAAVWLRVGDALAGRRQYAAAAGAYAAAAKRTPDDPLPLYLRGRALVRDGKTADGEALIEQAHFLPLGDVRQRAEVAEELTKRDLPDLARRERDVIRKLGWRPAWTVGGLLSAVARDAAARKDYAAAADAYERIVLGVVAEDLQFVEGSAYLTVPALARAYRARAALAAGKLDEAKTEAEACLALTPGNLDLAILLVPELTKRGRAADADALYGRAAGAYAGLCRDHPKSAYAHNAAAWLAACCRRDLDKALEHARTATEVAPKVAGYRDTLAEVHFQRGETAKAVECMKECQRMDPRNGYFAKQMKRFEVGDPTVPPPPEAEDD